MLRKLKLLYERLTRIGDKQRLKWATASLAIILGASVAKAGFTDPVSLSGFKVDYTAHPAFVDLDDDGDLDIVTGNYYGTFNYFQNKEGTYTELTGAENPFNGIDLTYYSAPAFADVDDDGDYDLLGGNLYGTIRYYRNNPGGFTEIIGVSNPFNGIDVGYTSNPVFADVDHDGDLDLVIGGFDGYLRYFQNDAVGVYHEKTSGDNPFDGIFVYYQASPSFVDFDHDGDLDLFIGDKYGFISYYKNDAGSFVEQTGTANPFDGIDFGDLAAPVMLDADVDGDFDLVLGEQNSEILRYLRNDAGTFAEKRGTFNPFEGILVNYSAIPIFADVDDDAKLDFVIGDYYGNISYYKDTLMGFIPKVGADNPFDGIDVGTYSAPTMGDVDNDGDLDLAVGEYYGNINYFQNDGSGVFTEIIGAGNPFNGIDIGYGSIPALVDFDNDGDLDLFIGSKYNGTIAYYKNNAGTYVQQIGAGNPLNGVNVGYVSGLTFTDIDNDGDFDLFIGEKYGSSSILYYKNDAGVLTLQTGADNPVDGISTDEPAPAFADIDNDGDLDLYMGDTDGKVFLSEFMVPGVTASQTSGLITTEAGGTDIFTLVLNSPPDDDVIITLTSNRPSEGTVDPGVLTFTPANWDVPQIVTLTGVDDDDDDGNQNYHISFAVASTDAEYNGMVVNNVNATNTDDEGPLAVEPVTAGAVKVYSVDHSIMLVSEDQIIEKVNVFDLSGQLIIQKNIGTTGTYELFVPGSGSGVYVVQTFTQDEVLRTKVIIH